MKILTIKYYVNLSQCFISLGTIFMHKISKLKIKIFLQRYKSSYRFSDWFDFVFIFRDLKLCFMM